MCNLVAGYARDSRETLQAYGLTACDLELQVHQRSQSRRDPWVKLAGVDIGDQSATVSRIAHCVVPAG